MSIDQQRAQQPSRTYKLVVVSGGTSDPSSTKLLADRTADRVAALTKERGNAVLITTVSLRELATEIGTAITSQLLGPKMTTAVKALADADGLIVSTPVYKAGASGLFTSFFHVLDNDLLIGKPVALAATAGTARHALVVDDQLRSLFAYLRTLSVPTSLFAASEDWSSQELTQRIDRAATELVLLMEADFARRIKEISWHTYQHTYGSAGGAETEIDLNTDLMRLATGGTSRPSN